jgi:DNA-binding transcriptional MerR regulator
MAQLEEKNEGWRIGELASATGVTVRTLHHYDTLGLLRPSERSAAGHRIYGRHEVERLYLIVALRELGLSLADIGNYLVSDEREHRRQLHDVVRKHLVAVEHQLELQEERRLRLQRVLRTLENSDRPSFTDVRVILEVTAMHQRYYTPDQLAELEKRREELGDEGMARAQQHWQELIDAVRAEKTKGTPPEDPTMQELAGRWRTLIEAFTGGDPGITRSLQDMYETEGVDRASQGMVEPDLMAYVAAAMKARS